MPPLTIEHMTLSELKRGLADGSILLVDVREPHEFVAGRIPGSTMHPLRSFDASKLPSEPGKKIVFSCQAGYRSQTAIYLAHRAGRTDISAHYRGGFLEWARSGEAIEV